MNRYDSDPFVLVQADDRRLALVEPAARVESGFNRADLVFYGVDHSGPSYEAFIYLNNPEATIDTPADAKHGYAGRFTVFGHAGCVGEAGHCEVNDRFTDEYDVRDQHPLMPATIAVEITDALRRIDTDHVTVTVIPRVPGRRGPRNTDTLVFDHLRLVTYD